MLPARYVTLNIGQAVVVAVCVVIATIAAFMRKVLDGLTTRVWARGMNGAGVSVPLRTADLGPRCGP
jgi:hypothetical protein